MQFNQNGIKPNNKIVEDLLNLDKEDKNLIKVRSCIQCGECSAACPSGRWLAIRVRQLVKRALMGDVSVLDSPEIWQCSTCFSCYQRCPRNIPVTDVVIRLRNLAAKRGNVLPAMKGNIKNLNTTGHAVPLGNLSELDNNNFAKQRTALGLGAIPPTVHKFPQALEEIKKCFEVSKFYDRVDLSKEVEN